MDKDKTIEVLERMLELRREPDANRYHTVLEEQQALMQAIEIINRR